MTANPMRQDPSRRRALRRIVHVVAAALIAATSGPRAVLGQAAQVGADLQVPFTSRLRFDYVGFRPARWETEHVVEPVNERPNEGGLVSVYFTNVSAEAIDLRFYNVNGQDESHWRLGGHLAWDRLSNSVLEPGRAAVLELNAVSRDFGAGRPFAITYVDSTWRPNGFHATRLEEDPLQVSYLRVLPGNRTVEIHFRHAGETPLELRKIEILGRPARATEWRGGPTIAARATAIARLELAEPVPPGDLLIMRAETGPEESPRAVYAHRRAFVDVFPIGCWHGPADRLGVLRRRHIDTCVQGDEQGAFFAGEAARHGMRAMFHSGIFPRIEAVRRLADDPHVVCWMPHDEPDWSIAPAVVRHVEEQTRTAAPGKPTMITLCRNVKFFEYASIPDIACMDHYCVGAPSSSRWPSPIGTRLEETAWYARDLKAAAEPRPVWVWTQGVHPWDQRAERPTPTPDEMAAQLVLNLGRGAKGILWFSFDLATAERYPDADQATREWGRVLALLRDGLLGAEPVAAVRAPQASPAAGVDVAALASWDELFVLAVDTDYKIAATGYEWRGPRRIEFAVPLPSWLAARSVVEISPAGPRPIAARFEGGEARFVVDDLDVCGVYVVSPRADAAEDSRARFAEIVAREVEDAPAAASPEPGGTAVP